MDPDDLFEVGRIAKAHGVRGEVKIIPDLSDPHHFEQLKVLYLGPAPQQVQPQPVKAVRFQEGQRGVVVLARFDGVDDRDAAERLRGKRVFIPQADLPPLDDDEFFLHDLKGLTVSDEAAVARGRVKDVLDLPAHPVLVVAREGLPDVMVPAVPAFIADIDFDAQRLVVRAIDGLFE